MSESLTTQDLDRLGRVLADRIGLQFTGKADVLADVLRRRVTGLGLSGAAEYLEKLELNANCREELRILACHLTVGETYFFRGAEQFRALKEICLPERIRLQSANRQLRLLSAGCASGEETYSLAILLREQFPELSSWHVNIIGVDVNYAMLAKACRARYLTWSLRDTLPARREKFFHKDGSFYVLDESTRQMVYFEERNLVFDDPKGARDFDIILCRNMIMYLVPSAVAAVIARITRLLAAGGYLFLGHAETLRGLSQEFDLRHTHDSFYYQKRQVAENCPGESGAGKNAPRESPSGQNAGSADAVHLRSAEQPQPSETEAAWSDEVRRATDRIDTLSRELQDRIHTPTPERRQRTQPGIRAGSAGFGLAFDLLRQERFQDALDVVHQLSSEAGSEPDTQLLRAVLLINCGDVRAAERGCGVLLAGDDLNAGAHYLMALCREYWGDLAAAMEHDRKAIHLDPTFAMPHLHLGRLARRSADVATARRELNDATSLLAREDTSRILLFGGGFSREALVHLSRAESRACGGRP